MREIAKEQKVAVGTVFNRLGEGRKVGGRPRKEIDIERVLQLRREGKKMRTIARELKIPIRTLYNRLERIPR